MLNFKRLSASFLLALTACWTLPFVWADQPVTSLTPIGIGTPGNITNVNNSNPLPVTVIGGGSSTSVTATYNVTPPTLTDGQSSGLQADTNANLKVIPQQNDGVDIGDVTINNVSGAPIPTQIGDGTSQVTIDPTGFDGRSNTSNRVPVNNYNYFYNGSSWDRARGGQTGVLTSFTGFPNVLSIGRYNASGITLSDGNGAPFQLHSTGELKVLNKIWDGTNTVTVSTSGFDGRGNNNNTTMDTTFGYVYNGTSWDRLRSGQVGVQTSFTGFQNVIPMGRYNASGVSLSDGNGAALQLDTNGYLKTTVQSISAPSSMGAYQETVGTSAVQLTGLTTQTGVTIKADDDNTDSIYLGNSSSVTTSTGYRLKPGQQVFLSANNANIAWVISGSASQKIHVIGS